MGGPSGSVSRRTEDELLDRLVGRGVLSEEQRASVVALHGREGGWVGSVLLAHRVCTRRALYEAWSDVLGLIFVNLVSAPPDVRLAPEIGAAVMERDRWIPWRMKTEDGDTVLLVATANPDLVPVGAVTKVYAVGRVELVMTTDWDILQAVAAAAGGAIAEHAAEALAEARPDLSARFGISRFQVAGVIVVAVAMLALTVWRPFVGLGILVGLLNLAFDLSIATKAGLCIVGARYLRREEEAEHRRVIAGLPASGQRRIPDHELPTYTILIPCYREANVLSQVLDHVDALDYPRSKKQVLLLLEEDDVETIDMAKSLRAPDNVRIVVLPEGVPKTKPRGCNVGLLLAQGEFLVIYDAEDRPEPGQLRDVVAKFGQEPDNVICVQARLSYFNANQNFLTRMFTLEYSSWFDYMLPGVVSLGLPVPLGGTSNHFRTERLRELGGWDPYNVTEDADLGIRCTSEGYRVAMVDSTTWEEACSATWPWVRQRTRWIKGFMITTAVHTRSVWQLYKNTGWRGLFGLYFFIGGTPVTFLANPLVVALGLYGLFGLPLHNFHVTNLITAMNTFSLVFGSLTMVVINMLSIRRRKLWNLLGYAFLNPVYWMLHSTAAWRALYQLIRKPSDWEKTPHGLFDESGAANWATPEEAGL